MGLFEKLLMCADQDSNIRIEKNTVYSPLCGKVISLAEINDGVFSSGVLGEGCGIFPLEETVTAPFDGEVTTVADTKHAIGLTSSDGVELLVHVGLDTVAMKGEGFQVFVEPGDKVKCGQKLLTFSKKAIAAAGLSDTTAVLVINSGDYQTIDVCSVGQVKSMEKLITVK